MALAQSETQTAVCRRHCGTLELNEFFLSLGAPSGISISTRPFGTYVGRGG